MILPDVNVLVHAFRSDSSEHRSCREWLSRVVNGGSRYGLSLQVMSLVIRVTTHPKVFVRPSRLGEVFAFCETLMEQPHCVLIQPGPQHWKIFSNLCMASEARGNLISDAWHAALAIESGCQWITLDRDYARFPGLNWRLPS